MTDSEKFHIHRGQADEGGTAAAAAIGPGTMAPQPALVASTPSASPQFALRHGKHVDISYLRIDDDLTLRRMVVHAASPKGTVLFLHGFPETLYAWKEISIELADDYDVHAFDWPGYGLSSRPSADRFSYAPREYARVLDEYISKAGIDTSM